LKSLIPWHIFIKALKDLSPVTIDRWLQRWGFTDAGVVLLEPERSSLDASQTENSDGRREIVSSGHLSVIPATQLAISLLDIESNLKVTNPRQRGQLLRDL